MTLETVLEIVKITQVTREREIKASSPDAVAAFIQGEIGDLANEVMMVVCFDTKMHVIALHIATAGSINSCIAHPREIFKAAILNNAASMIIAHNHPSYIVKPSIEDIEVTKRLIEAGEILGIELLDHLVVSPTEHYSIRDHNSHLFN